MDVFQAYLNHAKENARFFDALEKQWPKSFYNWKITVLFYVVVHCFRAYLSLKGHKPGQTHVDVENLFKTVVPVKPHIYQSYLYIKNASRASRYDGFIDLTTWVKANKIRLSHCLPHFEAIVSYMVKTHGFPPDCCEPIVTISNAKK